MIAPGTPGGIEAVVVPGHEPDALAEPLVQSIEGNHVPTRRWEAMRAAFTLFGMQTQPLCTLNRIPGRAGDTKRGGLRHEC